ncbi:YlcI/YnfO family protein [Gilliamella apicola]|uniref:YlcI/YnfO family protein n=1 Tax=Gilliamella apicola TaxID=1196095 RepID=UPI003987CE1E
MATGKHNNKSKRVDIRFPHEVIAEMELAKNEDENTSQFVINSVKNEIKRRKRKRSE